MKEQLFIFVEGRTDTRFFRSVVVPRLRHVYERVDLIEYASMPAPKFARWMRSVRSLGAEVIFVHDFDTGPSIVALKQRLAFRYDGIGSESIYIVRREIESWYLAGIAEPRRQAYKIRPFRSTERISKEQFASLRPRSCRTVADFMIEILKDYSIPSARRRNGTFRYFGNHVLGPRTRAGGRPRGHAQPVQ